MSEESQVPCFECRQRSLGRWRVSRLRKDRSGAVAVIFAFLLIPAIGAIGLAVDFSRILSLRSVAQTAADGAALMAVNVAKTEMRDRAGSATAERDAIRIAEERGRSFFQSYADRVTVGQISAVVGVSRDAGEVSAIVDYEIALPTTLGRIFGYDIMQGSASSGTVVGLPLHYDIHLLLDVSQSMGLGATQADMAALFEATSRIHGPEDGCAFGCHVPGKDSHSMTNSEIARDNNIRMRVDVLRDAVRDIADSALAENELTGHYRLSVNTFSNRFREVVRLTDDLRLVSREADRIDLGPNATPGYPDTEVERFFPRLTPRLKVDGDGLDADTAKQYVFIITDGVRNRHGNMCPSGHCTGIIEERLCQAYKDVGATVGVIYTKYLPIYNDPLDETSGYDSRFANLVIPIIGEVAPALQQCASPGWYFEASFEGEIRKALEELFAQVTRPPTLSH